MTLNFNFKPFLIKALFGIGIAITIFGCSSYATEEKALLFDFIPHNSNVIFEASSMNDMHKALTKQSFINANTSTKLITSLQEKFDFIHLFPTDQHGLLSLTPIGNKELVPVYLTYINVDSFSRLETSSNVKISNRIGYDGVEILQLTKENKNYYAAVIQQVGMISPSKLMIENIIRQRKNEWESTPILQQLQKAASSSSPTIYINAKNMKAFYADWFPKKRFLMLENFIGWSSFDIKIKNNALQLVGVNLYEDNANAKLLLLAKQTPSNSSIYKYTPILSLGVETYIINDIEAFENQKEKLNYPVTPKKWRYLFEDVQEVSKLYFNDYDLVSIRIENPGKFAQRIQEYTSLHKRFREHDILELEETDFLKSFSPLIAASTHNYMTQIDGNFFFATQAEHLESLCINVEAKSVWNEKKSLAENLSEVSSKSHAMMFLFTETAKPYLSTISNQPKFIKEVETASHEVIVLLFKNEDTFSYSNLMFNASEAESEANKLSHLGRINSNKKIINNPQFFTNWRTKQKDVLYQDENFMLHLTDTKGNELWSRQLDGAIVGKIKEIDIFKNTRIQMAFATQNKVYLIDKEGKDVKPFPLDFKDLITQELSVFDYDNTGNYRFVIIQDNALLMFDKNGKSVKGFDVPKTPSKITQPITHIKIGKKDYLLLQQENGALKILDRTGKERIQIASEEVFSGQNWYLFDTTFTSTTKKGALAQINEKGEVNLQAKDLLEQHHIVANKRLLVLLSENKLMINEVIIKLDYGVYLAPQLFNIQDKTYVSLVDQQSNSVYLFDEFGNLMDGFPVFGESLIDIHFSNLDEFYMITKGEDNSILIYKK